MRISGNQVSAADIARLAEVKAPAVSNWRQRHAQEFPRSERRDGRDLFLASEIAGWLDDRKIAKTDLKDGEAPGTTYGARFRKNLGNPATLSEVTQEALWQELERHRGTVDAGVHADLVLGLLYLCAYGRGRWASLVAAAEGRRQRSGIGPLLKLEMESHESSVPHLRRLFPATLAEWGDHEQLAAIIRVLDRHRRGAELTYGQLAISWAARAFEYLLARFAAAEGKRGAEFFTPPSVVRVLAESIALMPGDNVHDPCCACGGILVGAARLMAARTGSAPDLSLSGQALFERSWRLARMNLELNGLAADLGPLPSLALQEDLHAGRQFDVIMMNPPFNMSRWSTGDPSADPRWRYGPPPEHNANFAWLQHAVLSLADGGRAAVVMANGAASSENVQEQAIRAAMADDGVVECLIALPPQLFGATAVPVTIWLLRASAGKIAAPAGEIGRPAGEGSDEILFIDATTLGRMVDRNRRVLDTADIHRIAGTCEQWRARRRTGEYEDVPGFCESVTVREIREHDYRLNPRAHVRPPVDVAAAAETVRSLRRTLGQLRARSAEVDAMADRQLDRISTWKP